MSSSHSSWLSSAHWVCLVIALAIVAPCYWMALQTPATGIYHDDAIYLITGKSLAEGRGYTIESPPQALAQTKYPVLFPALLAMVWKMQPGFPGNLIYFKLLPMIASVVWLTLGWWLIRRHSGSEWLATAIVVATAASPQVVFLSTAVLSETVFAAICMGALVCWTQYEKGGKLGWLIAAACLSAAAYHTRTIGIALILAGLIRLAWQRSWRPLASFGLTSFGLALPWLIWQSIHRASSDPYLSQYNYYTAYNVLANFAWTEKVRIVVTNFLLLLSSGRAIFDSALAIPLGWIGIGFAVRGIALRGVPVTVGIALSLSIALILLWAWPPLRFLIPMLPLLLWAVAAGMPVRFRPAALVVFWLLFVVGAERSHAYSAAARASGCWYPLAAPSSVWSDFQTQLDWIRANTKPDDILQSNVDPTIYLFTGRHAIRGSHGNASLKLYLDEANPLGDTTEFAKTLLRNRVTYLIETPWPWFLENEIFTRFYKELGAGVELRQAKEGGYRIYRLADSGASAR